MNDSVTGRICGPKWRCSSNDTTLHYTYIFPSKGKTLHFQCNRQNRRQSANGLIWFMLYHSFELQSHIWACSVWSEITHATCIDMQADFSNRPDWSFPFAIILHFDLTKSRLELIDRRWPLLSSAARSRAAEWTAASWKVHALHASMCVFVCRHRANTHNNAMQYIDIALERIILNQEWLW